MLKCPHCGQNLFEDKTQAGDFAMVMAYYTLKHEHDKDVLKEVKGLKVKQFFGVVVSLEKVLKEVKGLKVKDLAEKVKKLLINEDGTIDKVHVDLTIPCGKCEKPVSFFIEVKYLPIEDNFSYFIRAFKTHEEELAFHEAYDNANIIIL